MRGRLRDTDVLALGNPPFYEHSCTGIVYRPLNLATECPGHRRSVASRGNRGDEANVHCRRHRARGIHLVLASFYCRYRKALEVTVTARQFFLWLAAKKGLFLADSDLNCAGPKQAGQTKRPRRSRCQAGSRRL
jgi:hypothetical protein